MILLPLAFIGVWARWCLSRAWDPLDVPVSLSQGHIRTAEFKINVASTYSIGIATDWPSDDEHGRCLIVIDRCDGTPSVLAVSWALSERGRVEARGNGAECGWIFEIESMGRVLDSFNADPGHYVLDLDITQDGSRLNAGAPHLMIFETGGARLRYDRVGGGAVLLFVLLAPVGTFLFIRSVIWWRLEKRDALARACSLTEPWPQFPAPPAAAGAGPSRISAPGYLQRISARLTASVYARTTGARLCPSPGQSQKPAFARTSWYGLIALLCFLTIAVPVCVIVQAEFHVIPVGLYVHLVRPGIQGQVFPGLQPIFIQLVSPPDLRRPSLYVDGQPVPWEDLETVLPRELKLRPPSWPVYLDGDPNMEWGWAGRTIDRIRGLQAEVVLLARPPASSQGESRPRPTRNPVGTLQPGQR